MEAYFMKIQADLIKRYPKINQLFWGEDDETVYVGIEENCGLIAIPKEFCLINTEKLKEKSEPVKKETIQFILRKEAEFVPAQIIGTKIKDNKEFTILDNSRWTVYLNSKFLKKFPKGAIFSTSGEKTAVRVYDGSIFIGIVMPVIFDTNG